MAVNIATLTAKLAADTTDFTRKMKSAERSLSAFSDGTKQIGSAAQQVGGQMTRRLTAPILGVGTAAVMAAANFESSMNRVGALTQETGATFDAMNQQAKDLGRETMFSAGAAADGMAFLAQAGFKANEITSAMPGMLDLAAAGQLDLAQAADIASNVLTGFNLQAAEANRVSDLLAATSIKTNTNVQQLGHAMAYVAPVAASAGLSIEETAAAIGLLGNAGIQGSAAGTTLRGVIAKVLKPTGEAADVIARLGLNLVDAEGNMVSLTEVVQQLEQSGATTADMMTMFGLRAGPGMAALVAQGADSLRDMDQQLQNAGGTAAEVAERQMEGLKGQILLFKSSLEAVAIAIGDTGLLDMLSELVGRFEALVKWMAGLDKDVLKVVVAIAGLAAAAGPLLWILGSMVTNIGALATAAGAAGITVGGLGIALGGLLIVGAIGAGVGALADKFINLNLPIDDATLALQRFYQSAEQTADLELLTGGGNGLSNLSEEFLNLSGVTAGTLDVLGEWGAHFLSLLPFAEVEGPMAQAAERFEMFDEILTNFAQSGDLDQAAFFLGQIAEEALEAGLGAERLREILPGLSSALGLGADEMDLFIRGIEAGYDPSIALANAQGELMTPLEGVTSRAEEQAAMFGEAGGAFGPMIDDTEDLATEQSALRDAVDAATEALETQLNKMRESVDPVFALLSAQERLNEAEAALQEMREEGVTSGAEYNQTIADVAQAHLDMAFAATEATNGGLADLDRMLDNLAAQGIITEQEAADLLRTLREIDGSGDFIASVLVQMNREELDRFYGQLRNLPPAQIPVEFRYPGLGGVVPKPAPSVPPAVTADPDLLSDLAGYASGGRPKVGVPSIIGERGPELWVPDSAGEIMPNEALGGGSITVQVDARGARNPRSVASEIVTELREIQMMGLL